MYGEIIGITAFIFALSLFLSVLITSDYLRSGRQSTMFWGIGIWLFAVATFIEILFALGEYSRIQAGVYVFTVAFLVQMLATGSILLAKSNNIKLAYFVYSFVTDVFLIYSLVTNATGNLIVNGIFYGSLPEMVTIGSSLITFPAVIVLVLIAILSYRKMKNSKLVSIIIGVVVLSASGALYIASFPAFLYIGNLIGIVFLWIGFVDFTSISASMRVKKHVNG